jgi:hypothetical protein
VDDELGAALAELGTSDSVSGGPYANVWSGIGFALENNQAVATIVGKLGQQAKLNATSVEKVNQANMEYVHLKTHFVGLYKDKKVEEMKVTQLGGQYYQLAILLSQMHKEHQQIKLSAPMFPGSGQSLSEPVMVNGMPVEDAAEQLQLQLQIVQSHLKSDASSVAGHVFESYEETYRWVVAYCRPVDWQCVMDIPALYSLVRPEGQ